MGKAILVVAILALVIYGLLRLWERRQKARRPQSTQFPPPPPRRAVAPDDDMDFLREIERKRRRDAQKPSDDKHEDKDS